MRRLIAASAAILLLLLLSQAVLGEYEPSGTLTLSKTPVNAGGEVTVGGAGFAPASQVLITVSPGSVLLATATTDTAGRFSIVVSIPLSLAGQYQVLGTGIDPAGSVRVLAATLVVVSSEATPPATSAAPGETPRPSSDPIVLALAGAGIVAMTGVVLLLATRSRRAPKDEP